MFRELGAIIIGSIALFLTPYIGAYSIIAMMVVIELFATLGTKKTSGFSYLIGMFLCEGYFLYSGTGIIQLEYFLYVLVYLFFRYKGKEWFINNNVNGYLYLLFTLSVPIFLDFITDLMQIDMGILLFVTLYLGFMRMSDWILTSRFTVLLFAVIQITSAYQLDNFIIQDSMKIYFVAGIVLWTLMKWKTGGNANVSRVFKERALRESSEGIHQGLS
ncbi:hypothetical protein WKH56_09510 [Priestia sp. SB1]|uniref:Nicotinamide riboside transporter PnuC n=1 Tax=Priestia aryabhattai TaxID=412384 RepID=A0AAX6NDF1_PRIAR|nr:hypothetical protein [Priestia aryabhattai]MDU9693817.1 hypothetical protein [Priestia aryabhattai]